MQKTLRLSAEAWIVGITLGAFGILTFAGNALAVTTISANLDTDGTLTVDGGVILGDLAADTVHFNADAITFEGATANDFELTLGIGDQTADRTASIPVLAANDTFVMLAATQTLTGKTLTSPIIGTSPTAAGATWADLGAVTTIDINGGTVDATNIGATTAGTGAFTSLTASGATTLNGATTIGDAVADTVHFNANTITFEGGTLDATDYTISIPNAANTVTFPSATDTLVGKATTDTFTNKTIDADGTGNSLTNIENADIKAAAGIVASKIAAGTFATGTTYSFAGSTIVDLGIVTTADINGGTFDGIVGGTTPAAGTFTALTANGATILGDAVADTVHFNANTITFEGGTLDATDYTISIPNAANTVTFPSATDTLVGKATTDTFTNKTIDADGTGNSITNIENADIKAAAGIVASKIAAGTFAAGTYSFAGSTHTDLGIVTTADINGGTVDATNIGVTTAGSGAFTTLTASGASTLNGATTTLGDAAGDQIVFTGEVRGAIVFDTATATDDRLSVGVGAGGAASFLGTLTTGDLTGNTTWTLPDGGGTLTALGADAIDFDDMEDTLNVDAATTLNMGAFDFDINLDSTGEFAIQDGAADILHFADDTGVMTFSDDVNFSFASGENFDIASTTTTADVATITGSVSATNDSIDGVVIAHTLTDSNTSAGLNLTVTNADNATAVDTFYGMLLTLDDNSTASDDTAYGIYIDVPDNAVTDADMVADAHIVLDNSDTDDAVADGILFVSAGGAISDAIDASATAIDNAISVGANDIEGTTATITFTDFTVDADGLLVFASDGAGDQISMTSANADYQALVVNATATDTTNTAGVIDLNIDAGNAAVDVLNVALTQATGAAADTDAIAADILLTGDDADGDMFGLVITSVATAAAAAGTYTGILIDNGENVADTMTDAILITATTDTATTNAINASDAEIVNALNVGANNIEGTTATITFTDFTVDADGLLVFASDGAGDQISMTSANADYQALVVNATATDTTNTAGVIDLNIDAGDAAVDVLNVGLTQADGVADAVDAIAADISLIGNDATGDMFGIVISAVATANAAAGTYTGILIDNGENVADTMTDAILITATTDTATTDAIDVSDAEIVNAINVGANIVLGTNAAITFTEFAVAAGTGAITINDGGDAGNVSVEGTILDINSLDFVGVGAITAAATSLTIGNSTFGMRYYEETTTSDNTASVAAAATGSTYYLTNSGNNADIYTLPAAADGLVLRFVLTANFTTATITVVTAASANVLYGLIDVNGANETCAAEDTITFVDTAEIIGDWVEVRSDGTNWYVSGSADAAGGMTCTLAS